jgi:hypothetical protein
MTMWLNYIIGAGCIIWAIIQTRTTLIYLGVLKSDVIPEYETPPIILIHTAIRDVIFYFICGMLFFIFSWPEIVTYILFALLLKAIVNLLLAVFGVGQYGIIKLTKKGKAIQALKGVIPVLIYSIAAWVSVYFNPRIILVICAVFFLWIIIIKFGKSGTTAP